MSAAPNNDQYDQLAKLYGIAAVPESVARLTQMVSQQDADVEDLVRVIAQDPALTARLLRVANPDADKPEDYTVDSVEQALMRNGIGCALLLAMGTPLTTALVKTFQTMLALKIESVDPHQLITLTGPHMRGAIGFAGKVAGHVYLRMSLNAAKIVAARILGVPSHELTPEEICDATGELLNIMTGNFKSNLCDAGLRCKLEPPQVGVTEDYSTPIEPGGGLEYLAFRTPEFNIFIEVTANPWNG